MPEALRSIDLMEGRVEVATVPTSMRLDGSAVGSGAGVSGPVMLRSIALPWTATMKSGFPLLLLPSLGLRLLRYPVNPSPRSAQAIDFCRILGGRVVWNGTLVYYDELAVLAERLRTSSLVS